MRTHSDDINDLEPWFGVMPGDDRVLIDWEPMELWIEQACALNPRLTSHVIGESTDGRSMRLVIVSSPDTIANLDGVLADRQRLRETDLYLDESLTDGTAAGTKPIVLITAGIHATEVGGVQLMPELIRDLAIDPHWHAVLERVIVLIVPTMNPDGMDLVHRWYRRTLGTKSEGTSPPDLYHRHAGHDNNRDWYQRHLQETRVILDEVHRRWYPHVVIDLHQMGQRSPRYVVPPYIDPAELHVHPLIYQLAGELGVRIVADHTRAGNRGVCSGVMFDCYSPTRATMQYHGGVRILAEAASVGIASSVHVAEDEIHHFSETPARFPSVHMPLPFRGGTWHLADIMRLHRGTIETVLTSVGAEPERWIADQWRILADQVTKTNFGTYVLPPLQQQIDPAAAHELLDLLQAGDVSVYVAEDDDTIVRPGSFVIPVQQPFGSFAETLLDLLIYPPGTQAYDVTSHCLPVHMGVLAEYFDYTYAGRMHTPNEDDLNPFRPATAAEIRPHVWLAIDARVSSSVRLINHALANGSRVMRTTRPCVADGRLIPSGSWLIADSSVWDMRAHAAALHGRTWIVPENSGAPTAVVTPRLAIYNPQHGSASDYGWLTLWLERSGFKFKHVSNLDVLHGALGDVTTLLVPHLQADLFSAGAHRQQWPEPYAQGLSDRGASTINSWMQRGGEVVAFGGGATALIQAFNLNINEPLLALNNRDFHNSGAVVRVEPVPNQAMMLGMDEAIPVMHMGNHGYAPGDSAQPLATFGATGTVISGTMHGADRLAGLHAIVRSTQGRGRFTALAFRPHFRTQMLASERLLITILLGSGIGETKQ